MTEGSVVVQTDAIELVPDVAPATVGGSGRAARVVGGIGTGVAILVSPLLACAGGIAAALAYVGLGRAMGVIGNAGPDTASVVRSWHPELQLGFAFHVILIGGFVLLWVTALLAAGGGLLVPASHLLRKQRAGTVGATALSYYSLLCSLLVAGCYSFFAIVWTPDPKWAAAFEVVPPWAPVSARTVFDGTYLDDDPLATLLEQYVPVLLGVQGLPGYNPLATAAERTEYLLRSVFTGHEGVIRVTQFDWLLVLLSLGAILPSHHFGRHLVGDSGARSGLITIPKRPSAGPGKPELAWQRARDRLAALWGRLMPRRAAPEERIPVGEPLETDVERQEGRAAKGSATEPMPAAPRGPIGRAVTLLLRVVGAGLVVSAYGALAAGFYRLHVTGEIGEPRVLPVIAGFVYCLVAQIFGMAFLLSRDPLNRSPTDQQTADYIEMKAGFKEGLAMASWIVVFCLVGFVLELIRRFWSEGPGAVDAWEVAVLLSKAAIFFLGMFAAMALADVLNTVRSSDALHRRAAVDTLGRMYGLLAAIVVVALFIPDVRNFIPRLPEWVAANW